MRVKIGDKKNRIRLYNIRNGGRDMKLNSSVPRPFFFFITSQNVTLLQLKLLLIQVELQRSILSPRINGRELNETLN